MIKGKRLLLTGGAGFIGTHLTRALAEHNEVVVLDTLRRNAMQSAKVDQSPAVELRRGDVMDRDAVAAAMRGCSHVVHLASIAGVDTVMKNPVETMKINMLGTINVLDEALANKQHIERVIDFSTSEVFGRHAFNVTEGDATSLGAVGEARWTYAVSKLATEHLCFNYYKQYDLPTAAIRPFNIYGPMQVGEGAVHHFILRAIRGDPLTIHNDGGQIRAWCYIDDIVRGTLMVLEQPAAIGHSFNIGNPRSTVTIHNLASEILRIAGESSPIEFIDWPYPDVELRIPDIGKARRLLGFEPQIDLAEGLRRTIDWYRTESYRTESYRTESSRTESSRTDSSRTDSSRTAPPIRPPEDRTNRGDA